MVEFISREMVIPETGKPIEVVQEQADVLYAMTHKTDGKYDYALMLYSMPKKSGKTTIAAAVALWQAIQVPDGQVYIIGNDQKQADNRMAAAIRYAIEHNPRLKNRARIVKNTITLDNGTKIESIPVDPRGEAGMNPTGLFWTEAWGAIGNKPELLWSEAALSPTRVGQSFKFVESYAGFEGESLILERLYQSIIRDGQLHSQIPELYTSGRNIGYWCTRRYMPWQVDNPQYYIDEAKEKTPSEFARIHGNEWSSSSEAFIPAVSWDLCKVATLPELGRQGVVIGVDAAVENDCFAVVVVTKSREGKIQVREVKVWTPLKNGQINFEDVETELKRMFKQYNVIEVAYDPYQMASMAQRLGQLVYWNAFNQGQPRLIADKMLYDMIMTRRIEHLGDPMLTQHIINADRKPDDSGKLRIVKRNQQSKIDAAVALSMACDRALFYNS